MFSPEIPTPLNRHYMRYLSEKAKLHVGNKLLNTVPEAKRVLLPTEFIRQWISDLQVTTKPSDERRHESQTPVNDDGRVRRLSEKWLLECMGPNVSAID